LNNNSSVKCLVLKNTSRVGSELFAALKNNQSLEEFHIKNMVLGGVAGVLRNIIYASKNLKYLNLNNCDLGDKGGEIISKFLQSNPRLENLYLGNTGVNDTGVVRIAEGLLKNTNLCVLSFGGKGRNNVTGTGRRALCSALFSRASLRTVANSNHSCFVQSPSMGSEPCQYEALLEILNRKGNPNDNRRWKVLSILYATKGEGIHNEFKCYQNLKLIPEMLAFISADCSGEKSDVTSSDMIQVGDEDDDASNNSDVSMGSIDGLSVESDESFDSYDSLMDDLDDFDDDDDEVYENFDKSFLDPAFCGEPARLTILFQVIQLWGLPLLDKMPTLPIKGKRPKKKRLTR